jgi:hypothetical protein
MSGIGFALAAVRQVRCRYGGSDRAGEYARLLRAGLDAGYEFVSLAEFAARTRTSVEERPRLVALRHDVDIADVQGNRAFHQLELAAGARSTYYFRWTTARAHERLIDRLVADGFEVGYHYEEAATVAKRRGLTSEASVEAHRDEIADLMRWRTAEFRRRWNPALASASSHGDWINRRLGFSNDQLVDADLLADCGIAFEAYGDAILGRADVYVSDVAPCPAAWRDDYGLEAAIADGHRWICILTHERRWHVGRAARLDADVRRAADEVGYRLRSRRGSAPRRRIEARPEGTAGNDRSGPTP